MATSAFKRYEQKFILSETQYRALMPSLHANMRPDDYCRRNQEYTINNIYFDTADFSIVRHSLSKPYYKEKLRLRSYGGPCQRNSQVFLELKKKIGGVVNKRRASLNLDDAYRYLESGQRPSELDYADGQVLREIDYFLDRHQVKPMVCISYKRAALMGWQDSDFRITFDHDILTRWIDLSLEYGRCGTALLEPGQFLMEIKTAGALPLWLARQISANRIYSNGFSKYGEAYRQKMIGTNQSRHLPKAV